MGGSSFYYALKCKYRQPSQGSELSDSLALFVLFHIFIGV